MESPSAKASSPAAGFQPIRRAFTIDTNTRRNSPSKQFSSADSPSPAGFRRRSSTFSVDSLSEARKNLQSSTDDLIWPKPDAAGQTRSHDSSAWHSAPLAFALLPALGGMIFQNGSSVVTDIMLLGLAAIFLNWSVRLPWDWYSSAQLIRLEKEDDFDIFEGHSDDEDESHLSPTLEEVPEEQASESVSPTTPKSRRSAHARAAATNELYTHEILALLSCFIFPALGAYLLHFLRSQLSRPSEGLVSNYNLTIFLLASELRPVSHLTKLIQSRTLHLQRVVNANPYIGSSGGSSNDITRVIQRVAELEARSSITEPSVSSEAQPTGKQTATLSTEVRKTLQPDLDALNRAVRRYEKRATLQAFQTESRLHDLESRLSDAISLAAAAANSGQRNRNFGGIVVEWVATALVLPIQALGTIASLPFRAIIAVINYGTAKMVRSPTEKHPKVLGGKYVASRRSADGPRPLTRVSKRPYGMQLKSDIAIAAGKFDPANNTKQANDLNTGLVARLDNGPKWWEVGAVKYRQMRWAGETALPPPVVISTGINFAIPSREPGRDIPCRVIFPSNRTTDEERKQCKGSVMHLHGGGWTLGDERSSDSLCQFYADTADLAVVSVGYRLAPEDPFPKGPEDCQDAGVYMVKTSERAYGSPLRFIGGESAGGHLSLLTTFHLLKVFPDFTLNGILLHFGCFDLTEQPTHINKPNLPIIPRQVSHRFQNAFLPNMSLSEKKSPSVSPYYENLEPFRGRLPSALFTCGTQDPLLDDSVMMGTIWMMAGGEAYVKIYTGAPHGFIAFPAEMLREAGLAFADTALYIKGCMEKC